MQEIIDVLTAMRTKGIELRVEHGQLRYTAPLKENFRDGKTPPTLCQPAPERA